MRPCQSFWGPTVDGDQPLGTRYELQRGSLFATLAEILLFQPSELEHRAGHEVLTSGSLRSSRSHPLIVSDSLPHTLRVGFMDQWET